MHEKSKERKEGSLSHAVSFFIRVSTFVLLSFLFVGTTTARPAFNK